MDSKIIEIKNIYSNIEEMYFRLLQVKNNTNEDYYNGCAIDLINKCTNFIGEMKAYKKELLDYLMENCLARNNGQLLVATQKEYANHINQKFSEKIKISKATAIIIKETQKIINSVENSIIENTKRKRIN